MSKQREALEMALDTLRGWIGIDEWIWPVTAKETCKKNSLEAITALREALAEPDPVLIEREACAKICDTYRDNWYTGRGRYEFMAEGAEYCGDAIRKRGEHEQEPSRKPLTDEEINALELPPSGCNFRDIVRVIERAHGIGD